MNASFHVLYVGEDTDIIETCNDFFDKKSSPIINYAFSPVVPSAELLIGSFIRENETHLFFIDFTQLGMEMIPLMLQIDLIKQHPKYRRTVFAGIFKERKELESNKYLVNRGFSCFFIKGNDFPLFLQNTYYITFDENPGFPSFAIARDLNFTYEVGFPGLITSMNTDSLSVSADVEVNDEMLKLQYNFLGEAKTGNFLIEAINPHAGEGDSLIKYSLLFPYPGPWDQIHPDTLLRDTIETFLFNDICFDEQKARCILWSKHDRLFYDLLEVDLTKGPAVQFVRESAEVKVYLLAPQLIVLESTGDDGDFLHSLLQSVRSVDSYEPTIILFGTNEEADKLRDKLKYKKLLVHPGLCQKELLEQLLVKYGTMMNLRESPGRTFKLDSLEGSCEIKLDITITGISEHMITFFCSKELPMYSNLRFNAPIDFNALVVPPFRELYKSSKGEHYMALIHGIDQADSAYLRKFVNQIIFNPLEKFERIKLKVSENEKNAAQSPAPFVETKSEILPEQAIPKKRIFKLSKL